MPRKVNAPSVQWVQLTLEPPPVIEVFLKVGLVPSSEHAQIQLEARDVTSGNLVAMTSWPHIDMWSLEARLKEAMVEMEILIAGFAGPF